ncbi:hypothetical protein BASA81_006640 [Batrachochytrium salamandrivorans]|nr:hypothetical protein BASA81_006640 [Batrachochytrium salamandrivorans]
MQEEKKQFVQELKRSSDVILVMQGVRAGKAPPPATITTAATVANAQETNNNQASVVGELEKQLEEAESALSHYDRCYQVVLQVVEQCEGCSEKLAQLQSEQEGGGVGGGVGGEEETAAAADTTMEDAQTKDEPVEET